MKQRNWNLFLPISQKQYGRHPTHSSWSCHISLKHYLWHPSHSSWSCHSTCTGVKLWCFISCVPFTGYYCSIQWFPTLPNRCRDSTNTIPCGHTIPWSHREVQTSNSILCLISRTTVTSLSVPKDTRGKTHPLCVNPGVPFWTREKTHKLSNVHYEIHMPITFTHHIFLMYIV